MDKFLRLKGLFLEHKNEKNAKEMSAYLRNLFVFYGIKTPKRREICKEILKDEKRSGKIDWDFLDLCYEQSEREFCYFVVDYLAMMQKFLTPNDMPRIEKFLKLKQWWDTIDTLSAVVSRISGLNELMIKYSKDNDLWLRRVAILHGLCKKERTNVALLEAVILNNIDSHEFFINKTIGWALRDFSKTNSTWVRNFLQKYSKSLSKLSIIEASKYT